MKSRRKFQIFVLITLLFFSLSLGFSDLWESIFLIPEVQNASALNKVNNWNFNGNSTGWTATNGTGTDVCGSTGTTAETNMETFAYDNTVGNPLGSFKSQLNTTANNVNRAGKITQTVVAPGSGNVKVKGRFDYYTSGVSWNGSTDTSWVRVDLYNNTDTTYVENLACVSFNSNIAWNTVSFGSDVTVSGGTTYTIRVTTRIRNSSTNGADTIWVDNVVVNFAPTGLTPSAPADTKNAQLNWTTSTAGTGAPGLHATTPYKVYRDSGSPVSTFLANATTNSYTDSSTTGNTTYYYAITDYSTNNIESPMSAEVSILTRPGAPGTPTFTLVKDTTLRVNWAAPTGGSTSYKVERCSGTGCSSFSQITSGETNLYYNDSGLSAGSIYRYRVRGTNATGDGVYSSSSADVTTYVISVSITANPTIDYGEMSTSESKTTIQLGTTPRATYTGTATVDLYIKSSNATNGTGWTLGSSAGENVFVHEFSVTAGDPWTIFVDSSTYSVLATSFTNNDYKDFDLRITTPTISDAVQKSISVTVMVTIPD
ncbi:MAG: fibronectin type III domain-containing protein [bacterium]